MRGSTLRLAIAVATLALFLGPIVLDQFWLRVFTSIFIFAALAEGWNIIAGLTGYPAFGNVVFFGIGAYTTGILMIKAGAPHAAAALGGGVVAAAVAVVIGFPILRLKGHYFAIATLGVNELIRAIVTNWTGFTGGGMGLTLPIMAAGVRGIYLYFYYAALAVLMASVVATLLIVRSRLGFGLRSLRDDEDGAQVIGVPTTLLKTVAWATSAFFTALAGGVYAAWMTFIEPANVFDMLLAVKFIVMALLGGLGTVFGPVVGAFVLELLSELVWSQFLTIHLAALGLIIMVVVIFIPRGFAEFIAARRLSLGLFLENVRQNRV